VSVGERTVLHDDVTLGRAALEHWVADAATDDPIVLTPAAP